MKKRTVFLTSLLVVLSMVFMGCGEKPGKDADPITVTFEVNGGSAIEAVEVGEDGLVQMPADPTKEGNKFGGWFTDEALTEAFDESLEITESITIYAKWIVNTYTVTFDSQGGSKIDPVTVEYKKTAKKPADPTAEGKYFAGWYTDKECTKVFEFTTEITADVTVYAKWTTDPVYAVAIKYNITGEDDGEVKATKDKEYKIEVPSKTRDGYTVKWYSDEACTKEVDFTKPFEANSTIYAKWTVIEYTITYELNGGVNSTDNPASYTVEDEITLKPATKDGLAFDKWYTDKALTNAAAKIAKGTTGNITLYAKFIEKTYTYTYTMASFPLTLADNPDGKNFQGLDDLTIPADVVLKKGDTLKINIIGSVSNNVKGGISFAIVDNTQEAGYWKVLSSWSGSLDDYAERANIDLSFELEITEDQIGEGKAAHKIVVCCSQDSEGPITIWEKDHDFDSKEIPIYQPAEPPAFENSEYNCAAVIEGASSLVKAGDVLTFYYTVTDPSVGWAQIQITAGWSADKLPGVVEIGNEYAQLNLDMNATSITYTLTEDDVKLFDASTGDQLRVSGHNISLVKVTKQ